MRGERWTTATSHGRLTDRQTDRQTVGIVQLLGRSASQFVLVQSNSLPPDLIATDYICLYKQFFDMRCYATILPQRPDTAAGYSVVVDNRHCATSYLYTLTESVGVGSMFESVCLFVSLHVQSITQTWFRK